MNRVLLLFVLLISGCYGAYAQDITDNTGTGKPISGIVRDSVSNKPLENAVVTYVETGKTDSVRVMTDVNGHFSFNVQPSGEFILIFSNVGYQPKGMRFPATMAGNVGLMQINRAIKELTEIVIQAPAIKVMQDTVEYRADAYVVRKDAVAEDLLKKLPGVEVDAAGNVTAQGQQVTKIRVNGKDFFGGDPKMATKNIPANAIDKIQVIDDASDQAKFSGFDDGDRTKIINITIRKDHNQGTFGSATAGVGTTAESTNTISGPTSAGSGVGTVSSNGNSDANRYEGYVRAFHFNNNEQMSILANANNINLSNFTQGGASFLGGGGRGGGGPQAAASSASSNLTQSNPYQTGYNDAKTVGVNYGNDFTPHVTLFGSYMYTDTKATSVTNSTTFNNTSETQLAMNNAATTLFSNQQKHNVLLNFGWGFTSHDSILLKPTYSYTSNLQNSATSTLYQNNDGENTQQVYQLYNGNNSSPAYSGTALWMHRFNKVGRTISLTATYSQSPTNETDTNYSVQQILDSTGFVEDTIHQLSLFTALNKTYSGRFSYTEPIGKKSGLELNYAFSSSDNNSLKNVYSLTPKLSETYVDSLSNSFDNLLVTNKIGLTFRHRERKFNYQIGLAVQPTVMTSTSFIGDSSVHFTPEREFIFVPIGSLAYQFSQTKRLRIFYTGTSIQPTATQLQPVQDITTQALINLGNPNLKPEFDHHVIINYNNFDNISGRSFFFNLNTTYVQDNISTNNVYKANTQYTIPINVTGYYTTSGAAYFSQPFDNREFIATVSSKLSYTNNVGEQDSAKTVAKNYVPSETAKFEWDKGDWLEMIIGGTYGLNTTTYINPAAGQQLNKPTHFWMLAQSSRVDFLKIFSLRYDFNYVVNRGYPLAVGNQPIYLLNAILESRFMNQNLILGLVANDLFNSNRSYATSASNSSLTESQTNVLQRFFMLTLTYKFQKFKGATQMPGGFRGGFRGGGYRRGGF